ncbi:MAG TPA: hypothetical protein DGG95_12480 [Cytophagales bacterium]|jgi:hypothetical protein|nr:hypothetical protein [Cytophagales bacterium]
MSEPANSEITRKSIREHISTSLGEVLNSLHIQTKSKKVQKLIEKASKKIASRVAKELKKEAKEKKKALRKTQKSKTK